jgi:hypothetical protein
MGGEGRDQGDMSSLQFQRKKGKDVSEVVVGRTFPPQVVVGFGVG